MEGVTTIGLDIAKSVFQVHGVDTAGKVVVQRRLTRGRLLAFFGKLPPCLVGIEACSTSHHWARELIALGHDVRLMPAQYVKPYVKRGKNDAADAEAICEAVTRPTMRFVPVKTPEQQSVMMLHRVRLVLIRYAERHGSKRPWLVQLMARRSVKVAAVALANKTARMIWALMTSGERYREPTVIAA
jgi:transposase